MKRINYLIVAMLMAFTMVGCQFDPTYLENKISGLEESDKEQNERLDSIESRLAVLEDKVVDADTMLEDLKVWAKDNLKGADGKDGKDGNDGINLTVEQIKQIQENLKVWFEENKSLFKGDKGDKGEDGVDGKGGASADSTKIAELESAIETLTSRIRTVENMLKADGTIGKKLAELETKVDSKADATTILTIDTIKTWYDSYEDKFKDLDLSAYLTSYAKKEDIPTIPTNYYTKSEVDEMVETVTDSLTELTSRVETLETILEIEKKENETISKLKVDYLALKSTVETLATSEALTELSRTIETLKKSVADNKTSLEGKITDSDTNIKAIETKVDNLEKAQAAFDTFVTTTTSAIATINGTLSNKANASDVKNETQIKELIANAITNNATLVTKEYLEAQKYLTSGSLSGYATTDKVNELKTTVNEAKTYIEEINSKYASLVSNMVEINANRIYEYTEGNKTTYYYYPYVKFINANGTVEYMTLLDTSDDDTEFGLKSPNGNLTLKELMTNPSWKTDIQFMSETEFNETVNSLKEY